VPFHRFQPMKSHQVMLPIQDNIQLDQKISNLRRSIISAIAPAGNANGSTGRLAAVWMSAIRNGDCVEAVINHVPAVSCIQPPVFELMDARLSAFAE
jgi:hypothetical protein